MIRDRKYLSGSGRRFATAIIGWWLLGAAAGFAQPPPTPAAGSEERKAIQVRGGQKYHFSRALLGD